MAIRMSQADQGQHTSEEDEIQRAIALSLEGGAGAVLPGTGGSGRQDGGWGSRLRQQEMEEEQRYKVELEKASRLEQESWRKPLQCPWRPMIILSQQRQNLNPKWKLIQLTQLGPK